MDVNGSSNLLVWSELSDNESQVYGELDEPFLNEEYATADPELSAERKLFMFVTNGILLTTVGFLGLVGNSVSIAVLSRPQMRSSINCCLIGLATFDMVVLATSIIMFGLRGLCTYTGLVPVYLRVIFPTVTPVVYPFALIAQTGSVWVTVTVTAERYVAVCLPLRAKSLCTYGRAKGYMVAITLFSLVYNLPRFWEVERKVAFDEVTNDTVVLVEPSPLRMNDHYVHIYINWLYLLVLYVVPFAALAFLNARIWAKVRDANKERQKLSRLQRKEMGLAIMLFCVVVVFFVCNLLALLTNVLEVAGVIVDELTAAANLLVTVNSSVNFVIYCIFGQKFRRVLMRTYCRPCCRLLRSAEATDSVIGVGAGGPSGLHCNGRRSMYLGRGSSRPLDDSVVCQGELVGSESATDYVMLNVSTNKAVYNRQNSLNGNAALQVGNDQSNSSTGSRRRTWIAETLVAPVSDDDEQSRMVVPSTPKKKLLTLSSTSRMVRRARTWPWRSSCLQHEEDDL